MSTSDTTLCPNPSCAKPIGKEEAHLCPYCYSPVQVSRNYRLLKVLGEGGMGRTYLSLDKRFLGTPDESCVVKEIKQDINDTEFSMLLKREAGRLLNLRHPSIPAYRDFIEEDAEDAPSQWYLVQQYIEGNSLQDLLEIQGPMPLNKALAIVCEVLNILIYLHELTDQTTGKPTPLIHLDIKPANLMQRRSDGRIFLIDFGIASQLHTTMLASQGARATIHGFTLGFAPFEQTVGYAAPASDLYSLCMTFLVLITGRSPLMFIDPMEQRTLFRDYCTLPEELNNLLDRMLDVQIKYRYQSPRALLEELERIIARNKASLEKISQHPLPQPTGPAVLPSATGRISASAPPQGEVRTIKEPATTRQPWALFLLGACGFLALGLFGGRLFYSTSPNIKSPVSSNYSPLPSNGKSASLKPLSTAGHLQTQHLVKRSSPAHRQTKPSSTTSPLAPQISPHREPPPGPRSPKSITKRQREKIRRRRKERPRRRMRKNRSVAHRRRPRFRRTRRRTRGSRLLKREDVRQWIQDLKADNATHVRINAVENLGRLGELSLIPALEPLLFESSPRLRKSVIVALCALGPKALPGLLKGLKHKVSTIRRSTATHAHYCRFPKNKRLIMALALTLQDNLYYIQISALRSLAKLSAKPKLIKPHILDVFRRSHYSVKLAASQELGRLRLRRASIIRALLPDLEGTSNRQKQHILQALKILGPTSAIALPALKKITQEVLHGNTSNGVFLDLLRALYEIGPKAIPLLELAMQTRIVNFRYTIAQNLARIGPKSLPTLERTLPQQPILLRKQIAYFLAKIGPKAIPLLRKMCTDPSREVQKAAESALRSIEPR